MKIDPWKHKEKYLKWREKTREGIPDISKENSDLILKYLGDMEKGLNVAKGSAKGPRSFQRLFTLKEKMIFFAKRFRDNFGLNKITDINEEQLLTFFSDMRTGVIKKCGGEIYKSIETQGKAFKAFWHWHQKLSKKNGIEIVDITADLDSRSEKPDWVYLTEEEIKLLCEQAKYEYRLLMMFIFDTGIRAPTELMNIKVSDFSRDFKELHVREEISKTFGRRIKIMLCSSLVEDYVKRKDLKDEEYLFQITPPAANRYLQRLAKRILGDKVSPAGQKYSQLTMYDFRHNSCCYWLPRYKSESALKYRFGWKKSEEIHYYSEFLGMRDTINEEDMLVDVTKTEIERKLEKSDREKELMEDELESLRMQIKIMSEEFKQIKSNSLHLAEIRS